MVDFKSMLEEEMSTREEYAEGIPSDIVTASQLHPLFDLESVKVESLVATAKAQLVEYVEKVDEMFQKAEALSIDSESTNVQATELGTTAMALFKKLDQKREDLISKPQAYVKSINSIVKALTEKLYSTKKDDVTVVSMTKEKITQYRAVEEQRRREREQAQQKAADELQKRLDKENEELKRKLQEEAQKKAEQNAIAKGQDPTKVVVAEVKVESIQVVRPVLSKKGTTTRTETGAAYQKKHWTFKVVDASVVPREYLVVSDNKVRDAIRGGLRTIPGIEIYEEDSTSFRT